MNLISQDYLIHHGVKGMKWGVRHDRQSEHDNRPKDRNNKTRISNRTKKRIAIGAAIAGGILVAAGAVYVSKLTKPNFGIGYYKADPLKDSLDLFKNDNAVSLEQGKILQRIQNSKSEDLAKRGELYVSYKFRDNMRYTERLPNESWIHTPFKTKLKATKPIKAPSSRDAAQIFLNNNPDASHADFLNFIRSGIRDPKNKQREAFVNDLFKKGYNAVIDENDAGWAKSPLIIINPSECLKNIKSRKVSFLDKTISVYFK